jgi:5-(carboxyamino)imidazole ribonucleotide synthase
MSALAAARLGIKVHIYTSEKDSPASQVAAKTFTGEYGDRKKLKVFAESVDFASYEFENIPVETVRYIREFRPVYPDCRLLEVSQNRISEKKYLNDIGILTAKWAPVRSAEDIGRAIEAIGGDRFILKTTRLGYDGKGQLVHKRKDDPAKSWSKLNSGELILEEAVDFDCEVSVIIARDMRGKSALYGPVLNEHKHHILSRSVVPAPIAARTAKRALETAHLLADSVGLRGVLALEMFVTKDGGILANEIAPRTHNSGHWTIDACACSQFEQHVRTVCGLPVGDAGRHSDAEMINLIGRDVTKIAKWYKTENACVHLYGKSEIKDGRKMGHVTILKPQTSARKKSR